MAFQFLLLQRKFLSVIPVTLELTEHSFLMPSQHARMLFHSSRGCQDIQGRGHCRKRKQAPQPTLANTTAWAPACSVEFLPPARYTSGTAGCFPSCEKRSSSQQSRTYSMNGGRGLRGKRILIALIARIQAFRNGLDGLTPSYLCYSK